MTTALAIPDPTAASVTTLIDACVAVRVWADSCTDIGEALEALDKVSAIETYLARRGQDAAAQSAARWLEVRIGELLGPAMPNGKDAGLIAINPDLSSFERHQFRQLAAYKDLVADLVPCSRRLILKTIKQNRAADKPDAMDILHGHTMDTTFPAIVIDPPWRYGNTSTRGAAEDHYPTMSMDELKALHVPAADNAHLYLWVTNSFLREGFDLIDAWGFTYKTVLTWCKPSIGMGNYFRNNTEHVLFATRGSLPTNVNNVGTWFKANKTRHSAKPQSFYDLVELASPGPYLEMFARTRRFGWEGWGNEA
jgi:N6-adenosine-specific RNA methylase IME4